MAFPVKGKRKQRKVIFQRRTMTEGRDSDSHSHSHPHPEKLDPLSQVSLEPSYNLGLPFRSFINSDQRQSRAILEELTESSQGIESSFYGSTQTNPTMSVASASGNLVPDFFTNFPPIRDSAETKTSTDQNKTIAECLPFLSGLQIDVSYNEHGVPHLTREKHIQYLHKTFLQLPAAWVTADASRPWMFYWGLNALSTLGEDISEYRTRVISTIRPSQSPTGGFGGGYGQMSHLAPTYASLLSLIIVGGEEALDVVDRKAMWKWLSLLKQEDGGFQMSVGGEEDVRGAYCAAVIISLLNLPIELSSESPARALGLNTLLDKLPEWVARCQTFEGGISARPDAEAHGAYAFCALACLCILGKPHIIIPRYLDVPQLISWLSARQYAPEGGFAGRTNKLVDGCYSHWVGGCWPLIEACLDRSSTNSAANQTTTPAVASTGSLYSREGLIRYILCCCQDTGKRGGLRDKPSHISDSYHSCYVLAGLSSAQHKWHYDTATVDTAITSLSSPYRWSSEKFVDEVQIYDESDRVKTLHPVFMVPEGVAETTSIYFASKGGF